MSEPFDPEAIYRRLADEHAARRAPGDAPPDEHDAGRAGHLGTVTDREWLESHERLARDLHRAGVVPDDWPELDYIWDPAQHGAALIGPDERDMAPRPGRYDPGTDERFHGGGFVHGQ